MDKRILSIISLLVLSLVTVGCSTSSGKDEKETAPPQPVLISHSFSSSTPVTGEVSISIDNGSIDSAYMTNAKSGKKFKLKIDNRKAWTVQPRIYSTQYFVDMAYRNNVGTLFKSRYSFSTVSPQNLTAATISPSGRVGIAQPIIIHFDEDIKDKEAALKSVKVKSSGNHKMGGKWFSERELHIRPETFWNVGDKVTVNVNIYGKNLGAKIYGQKDTSGGFTVSSGKTVKVSGKDRMVRIYDNGRLIKSMATSMGKPGYDTYSDTYYLSNDRAESVRMVSNGAEPYDTTVAYGTRMSYDGIYFHGAPWAYSALGSYDQSHGCLNLTVEDAKWVYDNLPTGTPVVVSGTRGGKMPKYDGMADWSLPFSAYKPLTS